MFCKECGKKISENAHSCPSCGEPMRIEKKSRSTAIIIAVLFGFWTWVYTYKDDSTKFWISLIVNITMFWTLFIPLGIWIWSMIEAIRRDDNWYKCY